jgi:hypothetical protein
VLVNPLREKWINAADAMQSVWVAEREENVQDVGVVNK